jgi:hypothetical protein
LEVWVSDVADDVDDDGDAIVCKYRHLRYHVRGVDAGLANCDEICDGASAENVSALELWCLPRHRCAGRRHSLFLAVYQATVLC